MNQSFSDAVNAEEPHRLVITSDWNKTLADIGRSNYDLLEFLCDAKEDGHHVIITSNADMGMMPVMLEIMTELALPEGYDLKNSARFELITKSDLKAQNLDVDYAFDDEPIATQNISNYVTPALEIRVYPDFINTSPLTISRLRALCELPKKDKGNEQLSSAPSPKAF
jgi:hypothetical protein